MKIILVLALLALVLGVISFLVAQTSIYGQPQVVGIPTEQPTLVGTIQKIQNGSMIVLDPAKAKPSMIVQYGVYHVIWTPNTRFLKLIPRQLASGETIADAFSSLAKAEVMDAFSLKEGQSVWVYKESIQRRISNNGNLPEIYASVIVINP